MGEIEEHGSHPDGSMNNLVDSDATKMQETGGEGFLQFEITYQTLKWRC